MKEISFTTIIKAVCKRWLTLGLLTVAGVFVAAAYVLAFSPSANGAKIIVVGAVAGFVVGVILALIFYFFNGKLNSANMLETQGIPFLCAIKDMNAEGAFNEAAAKLEFAAPVPPEGEQPARREGKETLLLLSFASAELAEKISAVARERFTGKEVALATAAVTGDYGYMADAAKASAVVLCIDGKRDGTKKIKAAKNMLCSAGIKIRGGIVVCPADGFVI